MKKRIISLVLAVTMMISLLPTLSASATASDDYTQWRQADSAWNQSEAWPASQYPDATMRYMSQAGCLVTSIAMLLRHYNVVTDSSVSNFNPWICNEKLKAASAFTSAADLKFASVEKAFPGFVYAGNVSYSPSKLVELYNQGYACIVGVKNNGHYVAVEAAGTTSSIKIMDPGWGYTSLSSFSSVNSIYYYSITESVNDHISVSYRTYGLLEVTSDETWIKSLPCSEETDSNSVNVESGPAVKGECYTAVRMILNDVGKYWYKVTRLFSDEVIGYIYAGDVEFTPESDLALSNLSVPVEIEAGSVPSISGVITSDHTKIRQVNVWVQSHADGSVPTISSTEMDATKFDLSSVSLDALDVGEYTLYIGADARSNYSPDGDTLSSATASPLLYESTFSVVADTTCTHSYTSSVTAPTYTSRGYTTYTCTKCGYSYKSDYTDVLVQEFRVTFDPNGGNLPSAVATNTLNGINVDRAASYLVVYNNGGEIADTNQYGIEVQVDSNGKVIGKREYLSETKMTVPVGGFILSGQAEQGTWVGEISLGYYVAYDEALMEVYVYDTQEAYEAHHKKVAEGEEIGLLPVPTREGYTFNGWHTAAVDGHRIAEDEFIGSDLTFYAYWISDICYDGHILSGTVVTAPTVDSEGLLHCVCTQCDYWIELAMPAFNTTDYEYDVLTDPTCIQPGLGVYGWLNYDYGIFTFDVDIDPLGDDGHVYTETVVAPTCTASGYTSYTCSVCGDSYTDTTTPATGHTYSCSVATEPTKTTEGLLTGSCGTCGDTLSVTLPVLSDSDYDYTLVQAPTAAQTGIGRYTWHETTYGEISIEIKIAALTDTASLYTYTVTDGQATITAANVSGDVTIPSTLDGYPVVAIGASVFKDNTSITSIVIPDSVTSIGANAFYNCSALSAVNIPDSVTYMGDWAFFSCEGLESVVIGNGVPSIRAWVFKNCTSLKSIHIGDGVTSINVQAFQNCISLQTVTGNASLAKIYGGAFSGCSSLARIAFSTSLTNVFDSAFSGCTSLEDVYYSGSESEWNAVVIGDVNNPLREAIVHYNSTGEKVILYGDVNSDGKVNAQDRMYLTRYLAGMTGYTEDMIDLTAADVNCDGVVNPKDRLILTRYLAQWTAYPELPQLS